MAELRGFTEPRIFTKPLRELTAETSRGFEVIRFAREFLHVELLPWQEWLLIHLLELNEDGTLRFRKALVIVGRQNGKTTVGGVLAAYWLYMDAGRWPELAPEKDFVIVGAAQKLDIAMKPWRQVRSWGAPDDVKIGIAPERVPMLQRSTYPPRMVNGEVELRTTLGAKYLPRTFEGARGHSPSKLLLDELREQTDFEGWAAIEKSCSAQFDSLLVAFSNAGTSKSVVLKGVRKVAHAGVEDPGTQWFVAEWSAPADGSFSDPRSFQFANPSAGYLPGMTIAGLMRAAADAADINTEKIEVLGQWVEAEVIPFIRPKSWRDLFVPPGALVIPKGARTVWGVDVSHGKAHEREVTWIAGAVLDETGRPFTTVRTRRPGTEWVADFMDELAEESGQGEVVLRSKGCAAMGLVDPLRKRDRLHVHTVEGGVFGLATAWMKAAVTDQRLLIVEQPDVDLAVEGAVTTPYADNLAWSQQKSLPLDISGVIAETLALWALEQMEPPVVVELPSEPVEPGVLLEVLDDELPNMATAMF